MLISIIATLCELALALLCLAAVCVLAFIVTAIVVAAVRKIKEEVQNHERND